VKISIVTLSFNQQPYLKEALDSVLSQGYPDLEYIVVDPGSTDGSREMIEGYGNQIAHTIFEPDRGAADGLNQRIHLFEPQLALTAEATATQAKIKRFFKESVYNRMPFEISASLYFIFRYIFQLGFLDGRKGFIYHILQGFWYRFLVGTKLRELEQAVERATSEDELRSEISRLTRQKLNPS
jgi:glycosyltransferase involved in cell wall biosynthesis